MRGLNGSRDSIKVERNKSIGEEVRPGTRAYRAPACAPATSRGPSFRPGILTARHQHDAPGHVVLARTRVPATRDRPDDATEKITTRLNAAAARDLVGLHGRILRHGPRITLRRCPRSQSQRARHPCGVCAEAHRPRTPRSSPALTKRPSPGSLTGPWTGSRTTRPWNWPWPGPTTSAACCCATGGSKTPRAERLRPPPALL